jgi:hypothetical protein
MTLQGGRPLYILHGTDRQGSVCLKSICLMETQHNRQHKATKNAAVGEGNLRRAWWWPTEKVENAFARDKHRNSISKVEL